MQTSPGWESSSGNIAQVVQGVGLLGVCAVVFLIPIVYNYVAPKKAKKAE